MSERFLTGTTDFRVYTIVAAPFVLVSIVVFLVNKVYGASGEGSPRYFRQSPRAVFEFPFVNLFRLDKETEAALHINNAESTRRPLRAPVAAEVPLLVQNDRINMYVSVTKTNAADISFQMKRTEITVFTHYSLLH